MNITRTLRSRPGWLLLLLVLLGASVLSTASTATASAAAGASDKQASAQSQGQVPENRREKGLVYDDLERDPGGKCSNGYRIKNADRCTHGPDAAPEGYDVKGEPTPATGPASASTLTPLCSGDGVTGKRTQVVYARSSDRSDRYAAFLPSFRTWAADADRIYAASAAETGGVRRLRFVHNSSCVVSVINAVMPANGDDTFSNTITALKNLGLNRTDRKYMVFVDANVYCGIGNIDGDDQPGSANLNNGGPDYGRTDAGCWGGNTAAHEHMHNIGGVQLSAPHTSGGWHCTDEWDLMCYSDTPNHPTMVIACPDTARGRLFDCNHDDYFNTSPTPGSYLATKWNAANSQYLIPGSQSRWGYVWANQPTAASYTPSTAYQTNSSGAVNTITRSGTGVYAVRFPNIGASAGMVHVTAYGGGSENCKVANWGPSGAVQIVNVRCFNSAGSPVDTSFTASYVQSAADAGYLGHVWANQPTTASYTPSAAYQYNAKGLANTITRGAAGSYVVRLPGLGITGGDVKVTAYGSTNDLCKVGNWTVSGSDQLVRVLCFTTAGAPVDTYFTMTFARSLGVIGLAGTPSGYVWANQPTTASYTPSATYQYNSSGTAVNNTITRSAAGVYQVKMPGLGGSEGNVHVSAYGAGSLECKVANWTTSGADRLVNVRCFNTSGAPADSMFTATYTAIKW
jgi:hypothetical protein